MVNNWLLASQMGYLSLSKSETQKLAFILREKYVSNFFLFFLFFNIARQKGLVDLIMEFEERDI